MSGQLLSCHSIVSSSRTTRPCSPWGDRWIGHWRTAWSTVCSSAPHSLTSRRGDHASSVQAGAETPDTGAEAVKPGPRCFGGDIWGGWAPVSGMNVRCLVVLYNHSAFHRWSAQSAARMLLLSDELISCCAAGTNGCLDLRRRAFALGGQVSAEWSWCPGSVALIARDSVAPLRRSSAGWMPARMRRLSTGIGPVAICFVAICKASLMVGSVRWVWALRHQTEAQYCFWVDQG